MRNQKENTPEEETGAEPSALSEGLRPPAQPQSPLLVNILSPTQAAMWSGNSRGAKVPAEHKTSPNFPNW